MHAGAFDVLAEATAAVQDGKDITDAIERVLVGTTAVLGVRAAAVLVRTGNDLELLAATSHRVADLELYQIQVHEGPCLEAIRGMRDINVGATELIDRWPSTGRAIVEAGYSSVHAVPLIWRGHCFGALNAFGSGRGEAAVDPEPGRLLAAAVTLVIAGSVLDADSIGKGLREALEQRGVIELAKGALAEVRGLDPSQAFDALVEFARVERVGVAGAARLALERARTGTLR